MAATLKLGSSLEAGDFDLTLLAGRTDAALDAGPIAAAELDRMLALLDKLAFAVSTPVTFTARGRWS